MTYGKDKKTLFSSRSNNKHISFTNNENKNADSKYKSSK